MLISKAGIFAISPGKISYRVSKRESARASSEQRSIACILRYQKAVDVIENALFRTAGYFKRTGLVAVLYLLFSGMPKSLTASSLLGPYLLGLRTCAEARFD